MTFGIGVFQAYFEKEVFYGVPNAQFQLSFAGTLIDVMVSSAGPLFQIIQSRFGVRTIIAIGALMMVLGLELAGFTTQIWHLYLTQGLLFGIGAAFLYVTSLSVPSQWFYRRRGLSFGIVTSGSGVGGVVLPFIITDLTNRVGFAWTYRILGLMYLGMNTIAFFLVKEKYPQNKKIKVAEDGEEQPAVSPPTLREIFDFSIFKDSTFLLWMVASVIATLNFFTPFFFLPSYALYNGLTTTDGTAFSAVLSGASCIGRIGIGFVGDRIGRINTLIICSIISGATVLGIWMIAYDYNTIMAFAIIYGLFSSAYYTLVSPITATIVGIQRYPTALSTMLLSNAISSLGPTIASGIQNNISAPPYLIYKVYTGATYLLGSLLLLGLKIKMTRRAFTKI
ncbi:major facilitator superfamily domain-containing protein [Phascolomyces articulosus]|uniref:Major facilitator superfamily domain-containing protein n=1 Tax=Phascolomyces articulosus TaxID=60185 RepID=A0AAD5K3K6_9FUNG|nr:major facilitator superfamily domain-containing protein [Phascolomyces articulosus]